MSEFVNACRTCLIKNSKLASLHKTIDLNGEILDLSEMLYRVASLSVDSEDGLPQKICIECISKLSQAFAFRKQCWEADTLLTSEQIIEEPSTFDDEIIIKEELIISETNNSEEFDELYIENVSESKIVAIDIAEVKDTEIELNDSKPIFDVITTTTNMEETENVDMNSAIVNVPKKGGVKKKAPPAKCERLCPYCGVVIQNAQYSRHIENHHNPNIQQKRRESEIGEFHCSDCSEVFNRRGQYRKHIKLHDPSKQYTCEFCGKVFIERHKYKYHKYSHTGERPFKCDICGKASKSRAEFNIHMKFHIGERKHKCSFCEKAFITKSHQRLHERTHAEENTFECLTCHKKFKSNAHLKRHTLIHDTSKHQKCTNCDKMFVNVKILRTHLLKHHGYIRISCEHCDKKFYSDTTHDTHMRMHHLSAIVSSSGST